jgi:uncharacterized protein
VVLSTLVVLIAGLLAGMINSIAGGGTLISFPALLWLGRDAVMANATSTVAIWPGSVAGAWGFRRDTATMRRWLLMLIVPSLTGGILGAWLLLRTPTSTFERLVPFLILGATILFALQDAVTRRFGIIARSHDNPTAGWLLFVFVFQFLVGIYGGYFGAGIGILMLAALGIIGMTDLHQMNGLKNILAVCINGIAAIYFVMSNAVVWNDVFVMMVGAIAGGWLGSRVAYRYGRTFVRRAVVMIGIFMTIALFVRLNA